MSAPSAGMLAIVLVVSCWSASNASAQAELNVGDTVEFSFLGQTKQAKIIKFTGTGWPTVKFEHRGREIERFFPTSQVKLVASAPTASGQTPTGQSGSGGGMAGNEIAGTGIMRQWVDATGKFKIEAKMLSRTDDTVELEKSDGRVIQLPVNKLCQADQDYLTELASASEADNPFAGGEMKSPRIAARSKPAAPAAGSAAVSPIKVDASLNGRTLNSNGWTYQSTSPVDASPSSSRIINLPPSKSKHAFHNKVGVATSFDRQKLAITRGNPFDDQTEVVVADLQNRRVSPITVVALKEVRAFALSPDAGIVATVRKGQGSKSGAIDFWKLSGGVAKHAAAWETAGFHDRKGFSPSRGMFVGNTKLLTIGRNVVLWDLSSAEPDYSIPSASTHAISHSGRELAMLSGSDVILIDVAQGNALGQFTPPTRTSSLAFSPGGQFLAGMNSSDASIWVWDLESNELVQQLGAPSRGGSVRWAGDRYLLVNNHLIDIELRVPVWQYTMSGVQLVSGIGENVLLVGKTKIASARFPHKSLDSQTASLDPEQLLILKPGAQVAFDFNLPFPPAEQKAIREKLTASLQANQVSINQSASLRLLAKVTKGKPSTTTLSRFGGFGRGGETVSYTPHTALVTLVQDGKTLWSQSTLFGPGGIVRIKQGQSAQQAVTEQSQPKASFFSSIKLPKFLAAMPSGKPLGTSTVTEAGVR